jgi:glucuronokinase
MPVVTGRARPRASLLGNPSDIYGGAGIAFTFVDFAATVTLTETLTGSAALSLAPGVLAATWLVFGAGVRDLLPRPSFAVACTTDVPRQVGLAGSSAIAVAFLRALHAWYGLPADATGIAQLALAAEVDVLKIRAGPMDRLAQSHEGLLAMDFARPFAPASTRRLPVALLPPLLIAWDSAPKSSHAVHQPVYERWLRGDAEVRAVVAEYRPLVEAGLAALRARDGAELRRLVNRNFDLRARLFTIRDRDRAMIELGRARGAATKFCGSGGAVIAMPADPADLPALAGAYAAAGFRTLVPRVEEPQ